MIESINLNLIPSGVSPVCHVSQYDAGRQIKINLFEGINPYTIQSGDSFTLNVRKPDNTIVTTSVSGTQGYTYITISTTEQIAAVVGENLCELKITNGSTVIGTLNFIMQVERDVLADGIPSQSVIEDLDERIAEAIGDNYYNKTETDALLALKADKSELYNVYPTEQESGAIAHFTDGADNIPVKSLVSQIIAVESGNGQPKSPSNPYTISGFDSGIITRCGKNLFDNSLMVNSQTTVIGDIVTLTATSNFQGSAFAFMPVKQGYKYALSFDSLTSGSAVEIRRYNASGTVTNTVVITQSTIININDGTTVKISIVYGNRTAGAGTFILKGFNIALGEDYQSYEPYNATTYIFNFGQTVFGGYFDNNGNFVVTHGVFDLGLLTWRYVPSYTLFIATLSPIPLGDGDCFSSIYERVPANRLANDQTLNYKMALGWIISGNCINIRNTDYTDANSFKNAMSGIMLYYQLANPITLEITTQDIPTLLGINNIFSDTGDVDVTIRADIGLYIDKRLNANRSTPNNLSRAAAYVDDPESVNESQEDNVEPQVDTQENSDER